MQEVYAVLSDENMEDEYEEFKKNFIQTKKKKDVYKEVLKKLKILKENCFYMKQQKLQKKKHLMKKKYQNYYKYMI